MTQQPTYGPHNPHPLSQMRTELVWEGNYDEYGDRREVDIARWGQVIGFEKLNFLSPSDSPVRIAFETVTL